MPVAPNDLSPQLARLFYAAGLLDRAEWENYGNRHKKHKPILDVLTQEVSLGAFKDLLFSEISLKSRLWSKPADSTLHQGLTSTALINNDELRHLLNAFRPAPAALLEPLAAHGDIDAGAARRAIQSWGDRIPDNYDWAFAEGLLSGRAVGQWLSRLEDPHVRLAAIFLSITLLRHNQLLPQKDFAACARLLESREGEPATRELLELITGRFGMNSKWFAEKLESSLTVPQLSPAEASVDPAVVAKCPESLVRRHVLIPVTIPDGGSAVITADPLNVALAAMFRWIFGTWPQIYYAPGGQIIERINQLYAAAPTGRAAPASAPPRSLEGAITATETPARPVRRESEMVPDNMSAVQLVSSLIESAIQMQTTDIHVEPVKSGLLVRFRIDGELHRIMTIPPTLVSSVISRIKVLASMDVTERRRPQDGHFELSVETHNYDFRISTLPAILGEKVVIRILDEARVQTGLDQLGLLPEQHRLFESILAQPYGLILVTGPTGSGKTSTLYAAMNILNRENRNLVTIEDPVEYQVEGINQVQVDPHIGLTFSEGLRSVLRQDPDVIMVGEIRDADTAHNAIRAAMTGHLVFSTLHTNTALGAADALVHLGATPFMVAGSLLGILSQRLLRQLCKACKKPAMTTPAINGQLGLEEGQRKKIFRPEGCDECLKSGYLGRTGAFEVIRVTDALRPLITKRQLEELEKRVRASRIPSLAEAAARKVLDGITSVEEVMRKVMLEE